MTPHERRIAIEFMQELIARQNKATEDHIELAKKNSSGKNKAVNPKLRKGGKR